MSRNKVLGQLGLLVCLVAFSVLPIYAQDNAPMNSVAVVRGQGALLLDDSGVELKATMPGGSLVTLLGRSSDGSLLYIESDEYGSGWMMAGSLLTMGTNKLPVRYMAAGDEAAIGEETEPAAPSISAVMEVLMPTPTPSLDVVVIEEGPFFEAAVTLTEDRLNLRDGPGTAYRIVGHAAPDSVWLVVARNEQGDWLQITLSDGGDYAWAAAEYLSIDDAAILELPIGEYTMPLPTPTSAPGSDAAETIAETVAVSGGSTGLSGTIVFQDRIGGTIYSYNLDTDTLQQITSGIDPAISNDGSMVAYTRDGGGLGVYVANIDGSGERILYGEGMILRSPKWSPDDRKVVFSRSTGYDECRALNGGVCLSDDAIWDSLPEYMRSGEAKNAIRALPYQREYFYRLTRIGVDGNDYRDLASLNKAKAPDWNEAGITYYSDMAGIQITEDADEARSMEVANDYILGYFQDPDWQPGGGKIVFQRQMNGQHWQIFSVNPDGTDLVALTHPVTALVDALPSNVSPAWSPDGEHIVYLSSRNSIESVGAWHIWVMNADGSDQRMLPIDVPLDYTFAAEQMVSWGPSQ